MPSSNSSYIDSSTISKMKVADLKKELKARGQSTVGTKTELMERLQSANTQLSQEISFEDANADSEMLDEDAVLADVDEGGEFDEDVADAVLDYDLKEKTESPDTAQKRPISPKPAEAAPQPKKRSLIRPASVNSQTGKENDEQAEEIKTEVLESKSEANEKKIIKLSSLSAKERLALRAQKFGVPVPDSAKKEARTERFGTTASKKNSFDKNKKILFVGADAETLKKRAERFGCNVSKTAEKILEKEKLVKRKERFGIATATTPANSLEDKLKIRSQRFQL